MLGFKLIHVSKRDTRAICLQCARTITVSLLMLHLFEVLHRMFWCDSLTVMFSIDWFYMIDQLQKLAGIEPRLERGKIRELSSHVVVSIDYILLSISTYNRRYLWQFCIILERNYSLEFKWFFSMIWIKINFPYFYMFCVVANLSSLFIYIFCNFWTKFWKILYCTCYCQ